MMSKAVVFLLVVVLALGLVSCRPSGNDNPEVICKLPELRGHCRALIPSWRYDPQTGKCREFYFGGCGGNANNFPSQKACMAVCSGV